jgi:hypothetical protein
LKLTLIVSAPKPISFALSELRAYMTLTEGSAPLHPGPDEFQTDVEVAATKPCYDPNNFISRRIMSRMDAPLATKAK